MKFFIFCFLFVLAILSASSKTLYRPLEESQVTSGIRVKRSTIGRLELKDFDEDASGTDYGKERGPRSLARKTSIQALDVESTNRDDDILDIPIERTARQIEVINEDEEVLDSKESDDYSGQNGDKPHNEYRKRKLLVKRSNKKAIGPIKCVENSGSNRENSEIDYDKERGPRSLVERKNKKAMGSENSEDSVINSSNTSGQQAGIDYIKRQKAQLYGRKKTRQEKVTEFEDEQLKKERISRKVIPIPLTPPTTSTTESYEKKGTFRTCYGKCVKTNEYDPLCAEVNGMKRQFTNPEELQCTITCGQSASFLYKGSCTMKA